MSFKQTTSSHTTPTKNTSSSMVSTLVEQNEQAHQNWVDATREWSSCGMQWREVLFLLKHHFCFLPMPYRQIKRLYQEGRIIGKAQICHQQYLAALQGHHPSQLQILKRLEPHQSASAKSAGVEVIRTTPDIGVNTD